MDSRWLDDVIVLLEEKNLSRAALRQNVTQPAFSRRMRALEEWLGTPILERGANRVDISPALRANETEIRALRKSVENWVCQKVLIGLTNAPSVSPQRCRFPN